MAGHFYYYRDLRLNLLGMVLHVLSNALDNADGQLARLTKQGSRDRARARRTCRSPRLCEHLWAPLSPLYRRRGIAPRLARGACRGYESLCAKRRGGLFSQRLALLRRGKIARASWIRPGPCGWSSITFAGASAPRKKFLLKLYLNYTRQQEWLAPRLAELKRAARKTNDGVIAEAYLQAGRPMLLWLNLLATNPRMILLFALLLVGQPVWYFFAELTVFNLVLVMLLRREDMVCRRVLARH